MAVAGGEGFSLTLPYPTVDSSYPVRAEGPYEVSVGSSRFEMEVPEKSVLSGEDILLGHGQAP